MRGGGGEVNFVSRGCQLMAAAINWEKFPWENGGHDTHCNRGGGGGRKNLSNLKTWPCLLYEEGGVD